MANILFLTNSLGFGGAAKMLVFVAESMNSRGHKVCIINFKRTVNVTDYTRSVDKGIEVCECPGMTVREQIHETVKKVKAFSADVIIGFTENPNVLARIAGILTGTPSIMSERGDPARTGVGIGFKNKLVLELINGSKGGVFQTDGAKAFYGRRLRKNGTVIPNPIFINGKLPGIGFSEREKTVVSVGRLDNSQKRYDVMIDAFKLFSEKHPQYILKLYGRGTDEEKIKEWAEERGLTNKVCFMGLTAQPMQDIAKDGMFLITSDYEGISNSLLEAMAVGLPCVSTDHTPGGARLLIQNGENGLLAPIGDVPGLAKAMCRFAEDSELAMRCGENARRVIERFAPKKIMDMWEAYILKICGNKR